jgi:4-carboxymuconolactone decarboxylase
MFAQYLPEAAEKKDDAMADRYETGMKTRREVLGDAHVDRAEAAKTPQDQPFQDLITEAAWGTVWASDAITRRERSMLTLALLAATGNFDEIPMHIRATTRTGASPSDVMEAFQHVAIYAGVPRANHAIKLAKQTYAEMETQDD